MKRTPYKLTHKLTIFIFFYSFLAYGQPTFISGDDPKPDDKVWKKIENLSDEFNDGAIDESKWNTDPTRNSKGQPGPHWIGVVPGLFEQDNVRENNGNLTIMAEQFSSPKIREGQSWNFGGGKVDSKNILKPGYYMECEMKANATIMSSTFWMLPEFGDCNSYQYGKSIEIDIQECIGRTNSKTPHWARNWDRIYHANAIILEVCGSERDQIQASEEPIAAPNHQEYHVYGCWWKSPTEIQFFVDGEYKYTINPTFPFRENMHYKLVTEMYPWQDPTNANEDGFNLPLDQRLTKYNWVRTWKLEDAPISSTVESENHIAFGKPAIQSSTEYGLGASIAVNGNTSADYFTHTSNETGWWRVDLEGIYNISSIDVHNRTDCCSERLNGASLYVGMNNSTNPNDYVRIGDLNGDNVSSFSNINRQARYVMVRRNNNNFLSLKEVVVQGTLVSAGGGNNNNRIQVNGDYTIQSKASGNNVIAPSWDNFNVREFSPAIVYPDHRWRFTHVGNDQHTIQNIGVNRFLNVNQARCNDGANVLTSTNSAASNSRWYIELVGDDYYLIPVHCSSRALDQNGSDVNIDISDYDRNDNDQKWAITPLGGGLGPRSAYKNDLAAKPMVGRRTQLNFYTSLTEDLAVRSYTFQYFHDDIGSFTDIHQMNADDVVLGNYNFIHATPNEGYNYYHVKIEYEDGSESYSNAKVIFFDAAPFGFQLAPNPAQDNVVLDLTNYMNKSIQYSIVSPKGEILINGEFGEAHAQAETIDLSSFQNGNYFIQLKPEGIRRITKQLVIMKDY